MAGSRPVRKRKHVDRVVAWAGCTVDETESLMYLSAAFGKLVVVPIERVPSEFELPAGVSWKLCPECGTRMGPPDWWRCGWCRWREIR